MSIVGLLKRVSVFAELSESQLQAIEQIAEKRFVAKGECLITKGERAKRVFVVLSGKFVALVHGKPVAEILPGEPIGELAFFAGGLRTSDVVAARDSEILQIDKPGYKKLSGKIPELGDSILAIVARRMAALAETATPLPPRGCKTVAIVPAGGDVLSQSFAETLQGLVGGNKNYLIASTAESGNEAEWLRGCEKQYDRIFLLCTEAQSDKGRNWLAFANRNCDCVCLIVDTADERAVNPSPHEAEILGDATTCPLHVVLWSQNSTGRPRHSAKWLAHRPTVLRHHICGERPGTLRRWLRFLDGSALGVVLCGGGALGTAHLGAVKALLEHGYDIDIFGGTSVGAAMAAALASRMPPDEIMDNCDAIFVRSKAMSKLAIPIHSILDHHAFDEQLKEHYGDWDLEDLPLNYFAVSTSLTTNDMHIHRTGSLWRTVRASGSIPAILPPMISDDGEVLIDGALVDNLPVDVMRQTKAGPNIILAFQDQPGWRVEADYEKMPSRLQSLWRLITRKRKPFFPSIATILSRTMVVTARRRQYSLDLQDDILIEMPTLADMGSLDWKKARQQYDLAYESMNIILERANANAGDSMERRLEVLREAARELSHQD